MKYFDGEAFHLKFHSALSCCHNTEHERQSANGPRKPEVLGNRSAICTKTFFIYLGKLTKLWNSIPKVATGMNANPSMAKADFRFDISHIFHFPLISAHTLLNQTLNSFAIFLSLYQLLFTGCVDICCCCCPFDCDFKLATTHTNGPCPWTFISFTCLRFQGCTRKLSPPSRLEWVRRHLHRRPGDGRSDDFRDESRGDSSRIEKVRVQSFLLQLSQLESFI